MRPDHQYPSTTDDLKDGFKIAPGILREFLIVERFSQHKIAASGPLAPAIITHPQPWHKDLSSLYRK